MNFTEKTGRICGKRRTITDMKQLDFKIFEWYKVML